jgi:hypothetical protein
MFQIVDNVIEVNRKVVLNKRQILRIGAMPNQELKNLYIQSLMGLVRQKLGGVQHSHPKFLVKGWAKTDKLKEKRKGHVLRQFERILNNDAETVHTPLFRAKNSFWVGIEIECLFPYSSHADCSNCEGSGEVAHECESGDCEADGTAETCSNCGGEGRVRARNADVKQEIRKALKDAKITNCSVKNDGSLEGEGKIGAEITLLMDLRNGFEKLHKVCRILNSLGASVNQSCGLHVHIDQFNQDDDGAQLNGRKLGKFLPILALLVPKSRRTSHYCKLAVSRIDSGERYYAINMTSLRRHKTIEVRLHSGSTDARKIEAWVKLLRKIVELPSAPVREVKTFQDLLDVLPLDADLVAHFDRRFQKFNPEPVTAPVSGPIPVADDTEMQGQDVPTFMVERVGNAFGTFNINHLARQYRFEPRIGARFTSSGSTYQIVTGPAEWDSNTVQIAEVRLEQLTEEQMPQRQGA